MTAPPTEIELKLRVSPQKLRQARRHPLLKGAEAPVRRKLYSVYFDTPELDLWRKGVALRVRRDGSRWLQAAKGGGTVQAGLHQRLEIENEVSGPFPDCSKFQDGALAEIFASPRLRAQLRPVFVTEFTRSRRLIVPDAGLAVEVAIDCGEIRAGERVEPISEVELELKSGAPHRLFQLARQLLESIEVRVENRSKAERGYRLACDEGPAPVKARAPRLEGQLTAAEAFTAICSRALDDLQANARGMAGGADPEYLHQMRVALRRLRAATRMFSGMISQEALAPVASELRWLARNLGPARDWDVFVTETLAPVRREFGDHPGLLILERESRRHRGNANRRARRAARSMRFERVVLDLAGSLATGSWMANADPVAAAAARAPAAPFAATVLEERYERLRKRGRKIASQSPAERHRLRIAIKKFRYASDSLAGLFEGRSARTMLKNLSRLQDILGAMNDAATIERLVAECRGQLRAAALSEARGIVLGWSHARAERLSRELRATWKAFRGCRRFWQQRN